MIKQYRTQNKNCLKIRFSILFLGWIMIGLFTFLSSQGQTGDIQIAYTKKWNTIGPPTGTLMIIGGAASQDNWHYFMELVGDPEALIVFIPTAGSTFDETHTGYISLLEAGAKNVSILHTKDRNEANTEAFAAPLRKAKAVFMAGGFQSRLAAAYLNTLTHRLMFEILERGGVIAGSSAGASIQGSYLYGGLQGGVGAQYVGLGFVKNSAIGQHYIRRNRMGSVAKILKNQPDLFGFGVDEATAAVVRGNELEVVGEGKVALYDTKRPEYADQPQLYLFPGDKYDMAVRRITHKADPVPQDMWTGGGKKQWKNPADSWQTVGPPQGRLLLYGSVKADSASIRHFLQSLGTFQDPIVVLSTGNNDMRAENQQVVAELRKLGADRVSSLHTIDSDMANSQAFASALDKAKAVWICDSRSWQLADVYLYTLVHKKLFEVLRRGGILGGNGDGAAIMASRLFGEPESYRWHTGYGLVRNTLIVKASQNRKTLSDMQGILDKNMKLQGIVLGEDTKVVIEKNRVKVEGNKGIRIYQSGEKEPVIVPSGESYGLGLE